MPVGGLSERQASPLYRAAMSAIGIAGLMLSPFTWWNDALVNIPLSLAAGKILSNVTGLPLDLAVAASYAATNVAGIVLMYVGGSAALRGGARLRDLVTGLLFAAGYTIAAIAIL